MTSLFRQTSIIFCFKCLLFINGPSYFQVLESLGGYWEMRKVKLLGKMHATIELQWVIENGKVALLSLCYYVALKVLETLEVYEIQCEDQSSSTFLVQRQSTILLIRYGFCRGIELAYIFCMYTWLAANWPPTMQIVRLISQDHMNNKQYVGKADFLVFRAMNQHGFLSQLQEKKLVSVLTFNDRVSAARE
ncbi:hypothetical protein HAX54_047175 [Datura stramonium]|uniref:Uncharacterized protein n=1 Tax=Datura stramonium TaxID=4076 RepID=A0ABS8SSJ5_DATST|nr:hypothetical protein [Datura stramonium]